MNIAAVPKPDALTLLRDATRALDLPQAGAQRWEKEFLALGRLYGRYEVDYWAMQRDQQLVALSCMAQQKREHVTWGRAVVLHWVWTSPRLRGNGYGLALQRQLLAHYTGQGFARWSSQVKSWSGFRLHWRLGCTFWGVHAAGRLLQETSLVRPSPDGVPPGAARRGLGPNPLTREQLARVLTDPGGCYRVPADQVAPLLEE